MKKTGAKSPQKQGEYCGERIKQARLEAGMSQQTLAADLGISFQQIQKYERGTNRPSISRLIEISAVFERPVTWFWPELQNGAERDGFDDTISAFASSKDGHALAHVFVELAPADRNVILIIARRLNTEKP